MIFPKGCIKYYLGLNIKCIVQRLQGGSVEKSAGWASMKSQVQIPSTRVKGQAWPPCTCNPNAVDDKEKEDPWDLLARQTN